MTRSSIFGLVVTAGLALLFAGCSNDNSTASITTTSTNSTASSISDSSPGPTTDAQSPATTTGGATEDCWVHIYDESNFAEESYTLSGPGRFADLKELPGAVSDWTGDADSIRVGPGATVTIWSGTGFSGVSQTLEPGSEHPNLSEEPESLEMTCSE